MESSDSFVVSNVGKSARKGAGTKAKTPTSNPPGSIKKGTNSMTQGSSSGRTYSNLAPQAITAKRTRDLPFKTACTKLDHLHSDDPSVDPSTPCADACPLLKLFGMYYCRLGLVCRPCGAIIPPGEVFKHLWKKHTHTAGTHRCEDYRFVEAHIMTTHHFTADTVFDWSMKLSKHVDGLPLPTLYHKCPIPTCLVWRQVVTEIQPGCTRLTANTQTVNIRRHMRTDHSKDKENHPEAYVTTATKFETRYVLRPYKNKTIVSALLFYADGWTPPVQPPVLPAPIPIYRTHAWVAPGAQFLQTLHYPQYVKSLGASNRRLRQLVQLPNSDYAVNLKHAPTRYLELGLCDLYDALSDYLRDANIWLDEHHPQARDAFVYK